jgi:hypothetical protein
MPTGRPLPHRLTIGGAATDSFLMLASWMKRVPVLCSLPITESLGLGATDETVCVPLCAIPPLSRKIANPA